MFDIVNSGVSGVQFYNIHLHQPQQAGKVVHPHAHTLATLALLNAQLMHGCWDLRQRTLVLKGCAMSMADQLQRSTPEMDEGVITNPLPIASKVFLGGRDRIGQKLQDVLAGNTMFSGWPASL